MVVIENELLPYFTWLIYGTTDQFGALWYYLIFLLSAGVIGLVLGYLVAAVRHGPMAAGDITYRVVGRAAYELVLLSPRRIWALTRLAIQESIRRRIFIVIGIYLFILAMASWFLNTELADPAKLQVDMVMTFTTFLILITALFLSTFSLPTDIKNRTIYTIVTKPTYAGEIILGRIFGFTLVGTGLLVVMGLLSYVFLVRTLNHTHSVDRKQFSTAAAARTDEADMDSPTKRVAPDDSMRGEQGELTGLSSRDLFHEHEVILDADGNGVALSNKGHSHKITNFESGPPLDLFQARVPVFGKLTFTDVKGQKKDRGISVGSEWDYLSYIEGNTEASAIWTFEGLREQDYPNGLPVEMYIRVYRSYKGEIEKGVLGSIRVRNPETGMQSEIIQNFYAKDFEIDQKLIPRQLKGKLPGDKEVRDCDLFADFVHNGSLEIEIKCLDSQQYYGMAQANLYIRAASASFEMNFIKGYIGVWSQMVLVICFGVLFSSLLSGPVALVATGSCLLLGFSTTFLMDIVTGEAEGGGPLESLIRTITQANLTAELEQNAGTIVAQSLDKVILFFMRLWFYVLPNFGQYSLINWVADGFNIPASQIGQQVSVAGAYVFGVYIAGYFFLRLREMGQ